MHVARMGDMTRAYNIVESEHLYKRLLAVTRPT
jgi:hypothetical protein